METAAEGFHAIRDARAKRYRYVLQDGEIHNVFRRRYAWFIRGQIDAAAMHSAGRLLIGSHDFQSFQAAGSDRKTTVRNVMDLTVGRSRVHSDEIVVEIEADGFLYNMVRNIVGTLVEVGLHHQSVQWPDAVRRAQNRKVAGRTAPPHGLFLVSVTY